MARSNSASFILMVVAAVIGGRGLHFTSLPAFWGVDPAPARLEAALYILAGVCLFVVAFLIKPRRKVNTNSEVA